MNHSDFFTPERLSKLEQELQKNRNFIKFQLKAIAKSLCEAVEIPWPDVAIVAHSRTKVDMTYLHPHFVALEIRGLDRQLSQRFGIDMDIILKDDFQKAYEDEEKIAKLLSPFFDALKEGIILFQEFLTKKQESNEQLEETLSKISQEYTKIKSEHGSMEELVKKLNPKAKLEVEELLTPKNLENRSNLYEGLLGDNQQDYLRAKKASICCRINFSCEHDTDDCGLFDYCEKDQCGIMDSNHDCVFYDSHNCNCKYEDN